MGLFGLLNYEDYLVDLVVKSDRAHNGLIVFILCLITGIVRFHLSILLCYVFYKGNMFDLIFPIIVTVGLSLSSNLLYQYIETHRPAVEEWIEYFVSNYSLKNFIRWKRLFLLGICCYVLVVAILVDIDNYLVILTTIQTAISFIICDLLEHNMPRIVYNKIKDKLYPPQVVVYPQIKDYTSIKTDVVQPLPTYTQEHPIIENYVKDEIIEKPDYIKDYFKVEESNSPDKSEFMIMSDDVDFIIMSDKPNGRQTDDSLSRSASMDNIKLSRAMSLGSLQVLNFSKDKVMAIPRQLCFINPST